MAMNLHFLNHYLCELLKIYVNLHLEPSQSCWPLISFFISPIVSSWIFFFFSRLCSWMCVKVFDWHSNLLTNINKSFDISAIVLRRSTWHFIAQCYQTHIKIQCTVFSDKRMDMHKIQLWISKIINTVGLLFPANFR